MKYVYIQNNAVYEIIPEIDPVFPGIPISERYPAQFLGNLIAVEDNVDVQCNMLYDADTGAFSWPESELVQGQPEPVSTPEPTLEERNRADIDFMALMLGVQL